MRLHLLAIAFGRLQMQILIFASMSTSHFHPLTISSITPLTDDCVAIGFSVPQDLQQVFRFVPGQYLTFKIDLDGHEVRRSYSICSTPTAPELRVAVKRVAGGKFSNHANASFKIGDVVEAMPPAGNFVSRALPAFRHYLCVAAGSGITPIISIAHTLLSTDPLAEVTLIFGNKNRGSIIFKEELEALKNKYMSRLTLYHVFSREQADTELFNGRITSSKLNAFAQKLIRLKQMDEVFICGPEEMILDLRDFFYENVGMEHSQVHFELFSSPDQPKVVSEEWKKKVAEIDVAKTSKVTIKLDGVAMQIDLPYGGDSILDAALQSGADLPYACKGGVCATCKAKLVSGEVDMEVNYSLEPDELAAGFILSCQSHPRTEEVVVDFDVS